MATNRPKARLDGAEMGAGGRDPLGRFREGHKGGPGRPPRATEARYLLAVADAVGPEVIAKIASQCAAAALDGDKDAREWLSRYLLPREPSVRSAQMERLRAEADGCDALLMKLADELMGSPLDALTGDDERRDRVRTLAKELTGLLGG